MARSSKHSAMQEIEILFNGYVLVVEAHVDYTFLPGRPAALPSYASGGDPPEGPEINIERIKLTRETGEELSCDWLSDFVETSLRDDPDHLIESASDDRIAQEDDAAEWRREAMHEDRGDRGR